MILFEVMPTRSTFWSTNAGVWKPRLPRMSEMRANVREENLPKLDRKVRKFRRGWFSFTRQVMADVDNTIRQVLSDIARLDLAGKEESELVELRAAFEDTLNRATGEALGVLTSAKDQLKAISWESESDGSIVNSVRRP